ncbi:hypothetical protein [Butyrivibrio sp. LC3010]|uniref:hypothetical protein n=1 Tax=Butyrivibrio sp. LC3010 TaxID=1280680 RepID=UPI00040D6812|nr:hypothetical protein [Butyrivibrio sp. LC3010]
MAPNIKDMENRLNTLYWTDSKKYMELLDVIKGMGLKSIEILRESIECRWI